MQVHRGFICFVLAIVCMWGTAHATVPSSVAGVYRALLTKNDRVEGQVQIQLHATGVYSGFVGLGAATRSFRGKMSPGDGGGWVGAAVVGGFSKSNPIAVAVALAGDGVMTVAVHHDSGATLLGEGAAVMRVPAGTALARALAGRHTLALEVDGLGAGQTFATITINKTGRIAFRGRLMEGTPFSATVIVDADAAGLLYVAPTGKVAGRLWGEFRFAAGPDGVWRMALGEESRFGFRTGHVSSPTDFALKVRCAPWSSDARAALLATLGWGTDPLFELWEGLNPRRPWQFNSVYYALPVTLRLNSRWRFVGQESYLFLSQNKWTLGLDPVTGAASGSYRVFGTESYSGRERVVSVHPVSMAGVVIVPAPGGEGKASIYGQLVSGNQNASPPDVRSSQLKVTIKE